MWQNDKSPEAQGRLENLKELVRSMGEFENMAGFLEHIALVMDRDSGEAEDKVNIMTLHSAKGLEFGTVFLPGWEEGLFPHQRSLDEKGRAGLEEERRLAYVGITRAKRRATISFAQNRRVHNMWQSGLPSRFVDELPEGLRRGGADVRRAMAAMGSAAMAPAASTSASPSPTPMRRPAGSAPRNAGPRATALRSTPHFIEGELVGARNRRRRLRDGRARLPPEIRLWPHHRASTATSSPSISTRPAKSACSIHSSSGRDAVPETAAPASRPRRIKFRTELTANKATTT